MVGERGAGEGTSVAAILADSDESDSVVKDEVDAASSICDDVVTPLPSVSSSLTSPSRVVLVELDDPALSLRSGPSTTAELVVRSVDPLVIWLTSSAEACVVLLRLATWIDDVATPAATVLLPFVVCEPCDCDGARCAACAGWVGLGSSNGYGDVYCGTISYPLKMT